MPAQKINLSSAAGVTTIELSDPPANSYSYEMMREIDEAGLAANLEKRKPVFKGR
jgi:enoyl-CoA hydratase